MRKIILSAFLLSFGLMNAQTFVSTTPQNKKVILEEFTGVNCVFCPQGHVIANNIKNANPDNVFLINIHVGNFATPSGGQPDFRTSFGTAIANQSGLTGYPAGTVNRTVFSGLSMSAGGTAMGRGNWTNAANQILGQSSYLNVAVQGQINAQTNQLTVTVETYYTGNSPVGTNKLNVALLQNNTFGPQTGGNMGNNYNHMHRLVHLLTGQWGTDITTTTAGSFNSQTFTYTIPAAYNGVPVEIGELELVAFVTETQQRIVSGNGAKPTYTGLTANDAKVKSIDAIDQQCVTTLGPKFTLQNMGQNNLTNLPITYSINGSTPQIFNWTGSITPLSSTQVTLPAVSYSLQANNSVEISIPGDDNNTNNSGTTSFTKAIETQFTNITVKITTDQYGSETTWNIKNSNGTTVASGGPYQDLGAAGTTAQPDVNLTLPNECYTFTINDSFGDGMFSSAYGFGGYQVLANGTLISGINGGNFTSVDTRKFGVNTNLGVEDFANELVKFYPNPSNGLITISLPEIAKITISDLSGKVVYTSTLNDGESTINLNNLSSGIYLINFVGDSFNKTDKIILK
jgi:hypothetical protein